MITKKDLLEYKMGGNNIILEQKGGKNKFTEMVSLLFHSRIQSHTLHLQTKSFAEHKALNDFYDGIGDLIDGLVESYQGQYGILENYKSYDLVNYKSGEETIKYFKNLWKKVDNLRDCCKDSYIQNQIDTVCELINSTLYKLKFLK